MQPPAFLGSSLNAAWSLGLALALASAVLGCGSDGGGDDGVSGAATTGGAFSGAGGANAGGPASTGGTGTSGGNASAGTGTSGAGPSAGTGGTGPGVQIGATCFPVCAGSGTDPDGDGYGFEMGRSCVVGTAPIASGAASCTPPPPDTTIPPGDGFQIDGTCHPRCASAATDPDMTTGVTDGWGFEMGRSCIVASSAPAAQGIPCVPPGSSTGDGYQVGMLCVPACMHPELADMQGYGFEAQQTCVVTGSMAALQNARCALQPRTLPPPGNGFLNGQTCFPTCGTNAQDVTAAGYGWDVNRTCIVSGSTAAIQSVPCVPPPSTVTGECPRTLSCPVVNNATLQCGCTWVDGLAERKQEILAVAGATQYFLASAMMETASLQANYAVGDGKTGDAFNAGLCKQNWGMMRRCHAAWNSMTPEQAMTSTAMNTNLALDVQVYNECRSMFGANWWSGHRAGHNNLGANTLDIQQFKAAMDWTNSMLTGHLMDDVRFWVTITPI